MTFDRLFVLWADADRRRHVVGHLMRARGLFRFWYDDALAAAEARGFMRPSVFPDVRDARAPYEARYLWATFAERIPLRARADSAALLRSWGVVQADDQFEILARSGGVRATDRLELAEYRADDDDLATPLELRVAGSKHQAPIELQPDEPVELQRHADNEFDPCATFVCAQTKQPIGYVPRQYSKLFARLLDAGVELHAHVVRRLQLPDEAGRWVIRAQRADAEQGCRRAS